jgi:hypothetical protein
MTSRYVARFRDRLERLVYTTLSKFYNDTLLVWPTYALKRSSTPALLDAPNARHATRVAMFRFNSPRHHWRRTDASHRPRKHEHEYSHTIQPSDPLAVGSKVPRPATRPPQGRLD